MVDDNSDGIRGILDFYQEKGLLDSVSASRIYDFQRAWVHVDRIFDLGEAGANVISATLAAPEGQEVQTFVVEVVTQALSYGIEEFSGTVGSSVGKIIGTMLGGPVGGFAGHFIGEQIGEAIGGEIFDNNDESRFRNSLNELLDGLNGDLGPGSAGSRAGCDLERAGTQQAVRPRIDPLVLDLDGDGIELVAFDKGDVYFDIDGDGFRERTSWVAPDDGILVLDRNGNGQIDDVNEMFGTRTTSGFTLLAALDSNSDRQISATDASFSALRVWRDLDQDGKVDKGELKSLTASGVASIDLNAVDVSFTVEGSIMSRKSVFTKTNGEHGLIADFWFRFDNIDVSDTGPSSIAPGGLDVRGMGQLASLAQAASSNTLLSELLVNFSIAAESDPRSMRGTVEKVMLEWAGVSDVDPDSRGPNFDARKLAFIERALGTPFQLNGVQANPNVGAAAELTQSWNVLYSHVLAVLFAQTAAAERADASVYVRDANTVIGLGDVEDQVADYARVAPSGDHAIEVGYWHAAVHTMDQAIVNSFEAARYTAALDGALRSLGLAGKSQALRDATFYDRPANAQLAGNGVAVFSDANDRVVLLGSDVAAFGGGGADRIVVSENAATRSGGLRTLDGGDGRDTLQGGAGDDWLDGGAGADTMAGGFGNDTYTVDDAGDVVLEVPGAGVDTVRASINYTLDSAFENLVLLGSAALTGTGNAGANVLTGNDAGNLLRGLEGADTLDGGLGADTMHGGLGADVYVVDNAGDVIVEQGADIDTVRASINYVLGAKLERLTLLGTENLSGTGNDLANLIEGNAGANRLDGRGGADTMAGGLGDDTYVVDNVGDRITEATGAGTDTVLSSVSYVLGSTLENLTLTGTVDLDGVGNTTANVLIGNAGDNVLDGKVGADTMEGGSGDDVYIVDNAGDVVVERANRGTDRVETTLASYTLGATLEDLTLYVGSIDTAARSGVGNALGNVIRGNNGANVIQGLGGNDTLYGLAGVDTLEGGDGDDRLDGGAGVDSMVGGAGDDVYVVDSVGETIVETAGGGTDTVIATVSTILGTNLENLELGGTAALDGQGNALANQLTGNSAANNLDGGAGADTMAGGLGNDTYTVDDVGDVVIEAIGAGTDTVRASISYALDEALNNLVLLGSAALTGTGNAGANVLTGNDAGNLLRGLEGADTLDGGLGADTMHGGLGADVYVVDNAGDVIVEQGADIDTVRASINYVLGAKLERLTLLGTENLSGTGNDLANLIEGNAGANRLDGRGGADTMAGGLGDDTYVVDNVGDRITEATGAGTDTVLSSVSYVLGSTLENLTLTGTVDLDGVGNTTANVLIGNAGDNVLDGKVGADTMEGGSGDDVYIVDNAGDVVVERANRGTDRVETTLASYTLGATLEDLTLYVGSIDTAARSGVGNALGNVIRGNNGANVIQGLGGNDTLYGLAGVDTLEGGDGDDRLDGGAGVDSMVGGAGDDVYVVDSVGETIVETAGGGTDTVIATVSTILGTNLENLELGGTAALDGQGNALANRLTGNSAANNLDGGAGADTMAGGLGNDTYTVDDAGDVVLEAPGAGIDTVRASVNYELGMGLENLILLGGGDLSGVGNELSNTIEGNAGANRLTGGFGLDQLKGNAGADVFVWEDVSETGATASTADRVLDFSAAQGDRIDLSAIDAIKATAENDQFQFVGAGAFTGAGQIRVFKSGSVLYIQGNTDNVTSTVEFMISLGSIASLDEASIIL